MPASRLEEISKRDHGGVDRRRIRMAWLHSNRTKTVWPYDVIVIAFCAAILILALGVGSFRQVGNFDVENDFYRAYAVQAENILAGRPYTYRHLAPGYVVLLAGVSLLTGDLFVAGKIVTAFATALFGLVTYGLLKALFDPRIALASTILTLLALLPHSFLAATDMVGALLMLLPLRILLDRGVISLRRCLVVGVCSGMAYLVRYNAVFVIIGIGFSLLFSNLDRERLPPRLVKLSLFICGMLLAISPWLIINWMTNGSAFASTIHGQIGAHFFYPTGDAFDATAREASIKFKSLSAVVLHDPPRLMQQFLKDVFYENVVDLAVRGMRFPAYLFALPGLLLLFRDLSPRRVTFLVVCLTGYLLMGLVGFFLRYYFFIFPLLFALVVFFFFHPSVFPALGLKIAQKRAGPAKRKERRRVSRSNAITGENAPKEPVTIPIFSHVVSWLCVVALAAFLSIGSYKATTRILASEPRYLLEIANFLRSRSAPGELIIVRKAHLAYLAGLRRAFPLANTSEEFLTKAREIGARYIAYSDFETLLWPGLRSLGNPNGTPEGLKLILQARTLPHAHL